MGICAIICVEIMKNNKLVKPLIIVGSVIVGLAAVLFLSMEVVPQVLVTLTKASAPENVSVANSYLIGQRILARADGKDAAVVNVFLLDKSGKGVQSKVVELTGATNIKPLSSMTDSDGKMSFEIVSITEGQFKINAISGGQQLPQTITVTFRN